MDISENKEAVQLGENTKILWSTMGYSARYISLHHRTDRSVSQAHKKTDTVLYCSTVRPSPWSFGTCPHQSQVDYATAIATAIELGRIITRSAPHSME